MYIKTKIGTIIGSLFVITNVFTAELQVDVDNISCDDATGTPFCTISAAITSAVDDDVVIVNPGVYLENVNFSGKDITLRSSSSADDTHINGTGGTTVTIGPDGHIEGFTITGGTYSFGAGMQVKRSGAVILSNIFRDNNQGGGGFGAAIGGNGASALISGNIFRNNSCDSQHLSGTVSFVNSSAPIITNNLFIDNPCRGTNMTVPTSAQPQVYNNVFIGNRTGIYIDRRVSTANHSYANNIIYNNDIGVEVRYGSEDNNPFFKNNIVFGNATEYSGIDDQTGLEGNLSTDPMFADILAEDFRLQNQSPAIDNGFEVDAVETDFLNNARPADGDSDLIAATDIGAFEAALPTPMAGDDITVDFSSNVTLDATESFDADGEIIEYTWEQSSGASVSLVNPNTATATFVSPANGGSLSFTLTVTDDLGYVSTDEINVQVRTPPPPVVSESNSGGGAMNLMFLLGLFVFIHLARRKP